MRNEFTTLLSIFFSFSLIGQSSLTIEGQIIDQDDNPIAYAHIFLSRSTKSTVSNSEGRFELKINPKQKNRQLKITAIGYKTQKFPIIALRSLQNLQFSLEDTTYTLDEIAITSQSPEEILKQAVNSRAQNYPTEPYLSDGFFRTSYSEDGQYVKMLESTVSIYLPSFFDSKKAKASLSNIRKSNNYATKVGYENTNWLYDFLEQMQVVTCPNALNPANHKQYEFELEEVTFYDGDQVYVIKAIIPDYAGTIEYRLFVDAKSKAFIRLDYVIELPNPIYGGPYDNIPNAEYYILKISGNEIYEKKKKHHFFKSGWREGFVEILQSDSKKKIATLGILQELLVHQTDTEEIKKPKHALPKRGDIYEVFRPYNPNFWKNYNRPIYTELHKKIKADLEKEMTLEEQFKVNGKVDSAKAKKKFTKSR